MKRVILKIVAFVLLTAMVIPFAGCAKDKSEPVLFEEMPKQYMFASGAGGWSTVFDLEPDGTFTGEYHDSNMGDVGEGYPHGSVDICKFSGKFSVPVKVDEYTYSMNLEYLDTEGTIGDEYIEDEIRFIYASAYGFDDADEFLIYLPGAKLSDLPEDFVMWMSAFLGFEAAEELPFYGIYNVGGKEGFAAYDRD